jgi:hypothetical protein
LVAILSLSIFTNIVFAAGQSGGASEDSGDNHIDKKKADQGSNNANSNSNDNNHNIGVKQHGPIRCDGCGCGKGGMCAVELKGNGNHGRIMKQDRHTMAPFFQQPTTTRGGQQQQQSGQGNNNNGKRLLDAIPMMGFNATHYNQTMAFCNGVVPGPCYDKTTGTVIP